ncbi:hypothetical protein FD755_014735 [Muntiacus reevesi]|uniref:Uncharacterized protein n=1 Tax=Muntiacus reevesi TaxID=9886 RepID=A0A5N3XIL5_MUNRE|nr:hypothetical protein FD755_014735 [Muntiacus reevesi]
MDKRRRTLTRLNLDKAILIWNGNNFLLTIQSTPNNAMWKTTSDCFCFQDWTSS